MDELELSGATIRDTAADELGTVEGFVVDVSDGKPRYLVVDSGGWLGSKEFLLPVGHSRMNADGASLVADVSKEHIRRFPGFDKRRFEELSEDEVRRMNDAICTACSAAPTTYPTAATLTSAWERPDFRQPDWWTRRRSEDASRREGAVTTAYRPDDERSRAARSSEVRAQSDDVSPHFDGRAQPGDVLGVETGGERTSIGDTSNDENERRRKAEEAARKRK